MWCKLVLLSGLVCLATAAQEPISGQKNQLSLLQNENNAPQVLSMLPSPGCLLNTKRPNLQNWHTYFDCTVHGFALTKCPNNMVFDTASSACIKHDTQPANEELPTCPHDFSDYPYFFPRPDCKGFYKCSNGDAYLFNCPEGVFWNQAILACDYLKVKGCGGSGPGTWEAMKSTSMETPEVGGLIRFKRK